MFRFEWCEGIQPTPWWVSKNLPDRPRTIQVMGSAKSSDSWMVKGVETINAGTPGDLGGKGAPTDICDVCQRWSAAVQGRQWLCADSSCRLSSSTTSK
jgi:hypothetical protein